MSHQTLGLDGPQPAGLQRCALQMLRVRAPGLHLAPALMTGLSALHYPAFLERPALAAPLAALRSQIERQQPALIEHGIHLIVQQLGPEGDLIIGDSHRYGGDVSPFSSEAIDQALLGLAGDLLGCGLQVLERWQGVYGSGPRPFERLALSDRVEAVWITSGIGMSVAPALAEQVIREISVALGVDGGAA